MIRLVVVLFSVVVAGCGQSNSLSNLPAGISAETRRQLSTDTSQTADNANPLEPGFRWTFRCDGQEKLFVESSAGKRIGDTSTMKIRTMGDSLFWSRASYVVWDENQLMQLARDIADQIFDREPPLVLFDASKKPGESWRYSENEEGNSTFEFLASVVSVENVTVPAGEFEAVKIEYVLGFHFGTEYDLRIWYSQDVGIVKIEKWRESCLGKKKEIRPIVYELSRVESLSTAHAIDYPSKPSNADDLPDNVVAKDGELTLYADFDDVWQNQVVLYIVNRTEAAIAMPAQDGDLYVKFETLTKDGTWKRAQTHNYSWCGNSYHSVTLEPNHFITILGWLPEKGVKQNVRYRFYSDMEAASNVGVALVDADMIKAAQNDEMEKRDKSVRD